MTDRLLDFSESPAFLSLHNGLLSIRLGEQVPQTMPLSDIAAIVASHRQVVFTQNLMAALGQAGVMLVCCDEKHRPASMLLPLEGHYAQAERFLAQAEAALPVKKRIWQALVRAKVAMQARVLVVLHDQDFGVAPLARAVRSGDPANIEATAAQRYWPKLFADPAFRRGNEDDPRNALLNYGYAVLRAITARAVCASGLHPSLGVNHRNRYNPFCLADDLMEPLRPLIDLQVANMCAGASAPPKLDKTTKPVLLGAMAARYRVLGESRTLFDIVARQARAVAAVYLGQDAKFSCECVEIPT
jgi:CRISP-associated protein Cas1